MRRLPNRYFSPLWLGFDLDVHPVTKIATVTQTANAFSLGGGLAVASNVASINQ